jgi:hypothetical protein
MNKLLQSKPSPKDQNASNFEKDESAIYDQFWEVCTGVFPCQGTTRGLMIFVWQCSNTSPREISWLFSSSTVLYLLWSASHCSPTFSLVPYPKNTSRAVGPYLASKANFKRGGFSIKKKSQGFSSIQSKPMGRLLLLMK